MKNVEKQFKPRKLNLGKRTVAQLDSDYLRRLKGGDGLTGATTNISAANGHCVRTTQKPTSDTEEIDLPPGP